MLDEQRYDFDRVFRLLISAGTILLLFFLLRYLSEVLIPFVIAFLMAYLLHPLVSRVQRRIRNRTVAVLLTVVRRARHAAPGHGMPCPYDRDITFSHRFGRAGLFVFEYSASVRPFG